MSEAPRENESGARHNSSKIHEHHVHSSFRSDLTALDKKKRQEFIIEGASCASCVSKIEAALQQVPAVSGVEMNFAQRIVTVTGEADDSDLIKAVEKAGYSAKPMKPGGDADALDEKEQAERVYYKRLMRETTIALAAGKYDFHCQMQMYRGQIVVK